MVLVGPMIHVKENMWIGRIYAGLRASINGSAGLVGIMLPELRTSSDGRYYYADMPGRLADNIISEYASLYSWNYAINHFDAIIEDAYNRRISKKNQIDNSRIQMRRNLGSDE